MAVGTDLSRNPYLPSAVVEDPDDLKLVVANSKYIDWREGWLARFHGEDAQDKKIQTKRTSEA